MSLVSLGDRPMSTPDAKRQKLVSPFDDFSFENDADDLNVSFSDLFLGTISTDPQMEFEHSDLIHDMHSLVPSVCKFLSKQDPIHTERFTHYLKLMSSESFLSLTCAISCSMVSSSGTLVLVALKYAIAMTPTNSGV